MRIHAMMGEYKIAEAVENSQTKCFDPAARFAYKFQVACVAAASNTAQSAIRGMAVDHRQSGRVLSGFAGTRFVTHSLRRMLHAQDIPRQLPLRQSSLRSGYRPELG